MFTKIATLCLGLAMIFSLSSATMIESNNTVSTVVAAAPVTTSACSCFAADFKWKPNFQTRACDAFFKVGLVAQPCIASEIPKSDIVSVVWNFGDGTTGTGQSVYHVYGGACPSYPIVVCATVTAVVDNGISEEFCTYSVCKLISLS